MSIILRQGSRSRFRNCYVCYCFRRLAAFGLLHRVPAIFYSGVWTVRMQRRFFTFFIWIYQVLGSCPGCNARSIGLAVLTLFCFFINVGNTFSPRVSFTNWSAFSRLLGRTGATLTARPLAVIHLLLRYTETQLRSWARSSFLRTTTFVRRNLTFVHSVPTANAQLLRGLLVLHLRVADLNLPLHDDWLLLLEVGAMFNLEFCRPYLLLYISDLFDQEFTIRYLCASSL